MTGRTVPEAYALRAAGLADPLGVPTPRPGLSWRLRGEIAPLGAVVEGASDRDALLAGRADRFRVEVASSNRLSWPAADLLSRERVWWRVGVSSTGGMAWSDPARIEAALWADADWDADAITHPDWLRVSDAARPEAFPELRREFTVEGPIVEARLYLSGAGVVVPSLNGRAAIRGQLEPGYSTLSIGVPASAWDVTDLLRTGANVLDVRLGGGIADVPGLTDRYTKFSDPSGTPWVRLRLEVFDRSGAATVLATGTDWLTRLGSTTVAHWYGGEDEVLSAVGEWEPAAVVPDAVPSWWRATPPVVVQDVLEVWSWREDAAVRTLDFGLNTAGRPLVRTDRLPAGARLRLAPAELVGPGGRIDQASTGSPIFDTVHLGRREEQLFSPDWVPSFVYHGGRFLEVEGLPADAPADTIAFQTMRADNEAVGSFSSSDVFLDDLHRIIDRAVQSNMYSVLTDCPHREKLGWLEQLHLCFDTLTRGYDVEAQLTDAVKHMMDAQTETGLIPSTVPELVVFDTFPWKDDRDAFRDDPNWGRSIVEVPWRLYTHTGGADLIRTAFPAMQRYLAHLESRADGDLLDFGLGDWIEIDDTTPRAMVATHAWASTLDHAAAAARVVGEESTAGLWAARAADVWLAFTAQFRDPVSGVWGSGSQGSWAIAWSTPGLDDPERARIIDRLVARIHADDDALTVGEIALSWFIRALTDSGHSELLHRMLRRTDAPGYGHQLATGATALTESWEGPSARTGVASQNHFMLSAIDDWIVGDVAGLRQTPGAVGWRSITVRPRTLDGVDDARTVFDSPAGRFEVAWCRDQDGGRATLDIVAPPGVEVLVPEHERFRVTRRRA